MLRRVVRHIKHVGSANIQYAFNAETNVIIEIKPQSLFCLASNFGISAGFVATKIALGYTLDEIGEMGAPILPMWRPKWII